MSLAHFPVRSFASCSCSPKSRRRKALAALRLRRASHYGCEVLEPRRLLSTVTWTGNSGDNLWTDGGNWSNPGNPGAFPGSGDDAVINLSGAQVTLNTTASAASLTTTAGTSLQIGGGGNLTLGPDVSNIAGGLTLDGVLNTGTGAVTLAGSTSLDRASQFVIGSTAVTNTGTITSGNIGNGNAPDLISGTLDNQGTFNMGNDDLLFQGNATLDNQVTGIFNIQSDNNVRNGGGGGNFLNEGTIEKTVTTGTSNFELNLTSTGSVDVQTGALVLNNGNGTTTINGGNFTVADGTALLMTNGGGGVSVTGTLTGSGTGNGVITTGFGTVFIGPGGATFNFPAGLFTWTSTINAAQGTLTNTGVITTADPFNGNGSLLQGGILANQGTINLAAANHDLNFQSGAVLDNQSTGIFDFQSDNNVRDGGGGGNSFQNEGTVEKTVTSGTSTFAVSLTNTGTIHGVTGTLGLTGGGSTATLIGGTYNADADAAVDLAFNGEAILTGTLTGSGAGAVMFPYTNNADSFAVGLGGATLDFPGSLFQWAGGSLTGQLGDLTNIGTLNITAASDVLFSQDGTLFDKGTIVQTGTGNLGLHSDSVSPTTLNVEAGGSYLMESDSGIDNAAGGTSAVINAGTIEKTAGSGNSTILVNGTLSNTGAIIAASGSLSLNAATIAQLSSSTLTAGTWDAVNGAALGFPSGSNITTNQGSIALSGAGASISGLSNLASNAGGFTVTAGATFSTTANFDNSGTVTLGPASMLSVNGTFKQEPVGTLAVQLGSAPAGGQFGSLSSTGIATLNGTLQVSLVNGYTPAKGDSFQVMIFPGETGSFSKVVQPLFHGGDLFQVQTNPSNVTLNAATSVADLAVSSISVSPTSVSVGQNITVDYNVTNGGQATSSSQWVDAVFLTTGTSVNGSAVLLGHVTHIGTVQAGGNYDGSLTATLPPVLPGTDHIIVVADSQGLVPDGNRSNNLLVAPTTVHTSVPTLTLTPIGGTPTPATGTIAAAQDVVFQLSVTAGEDVQVTLKTGTAGAAELLAGFDAIPTEAGSQAAAFDPSQSQQQFSLAVTQAGTYYIEPVGEPVAGAGTSFSLTAQLLPFAVSTASPGDVGNTGRVTLKVTGAELAATDTFKLLGPGGASFGDSAVDVIDPANAFVTFDLTGAALGTYSLQGASPAGQSVLPNAVTVQPGRSAPISTQVQLPNAQRIGRPVNAGVAYQNTGNVDEPAPLFILSSNNDNLLLSATGAANLANGEVLLMGMSFDGPAGILRPGAFVTLPFVEQSQVEAGDPGPDGDKDDNGSSGPPPAPQTVQVLIETVDSTEPLNDSDLAQFLGLTQTDPVMQQILQDTGNTWGGLVRLLDESATNAIAEGDQVHSAVDVFQQLLQDETFKVDGGVSGQLFLNDTGHPLAGALVTIATADGSQADSAVSESDGTFEFPQMLAGTYNLTVDGYLLPQPVQVTVPASGSVSGLNITAMPGGTIAGIVTGTGNGKLLGGVQVTAVNDQNVSFTAQTGADGSYQLTGLPDGTYTVTAGGDSFDTQTSGPESIANAQGVSGVNFVLEPGATVRGDVINAADGTAVAQAEVIAVDGNGVAFPVSTDANGAYSITNLPPGTYLLTVQADGFATANLGSVTLSAGARLTEPVASLVPPATVTVTVQDTNSNPISGGDVELLQGGSEVAATFTDSSGQATLTGVEPGTYQVAILATGFLSTAEGIVVASGQTGSLAITLGPAPDIHGVVTDATGAPLANVPVLVLAQDGTQQTISTGADGSYDFNTLDPGTYAVSVGQSPGVDRTDVVVDTSHLVQVVNFTLAGATVSGAVVGSDGTTPLADAVVALAQGNSVLVTTTTDSNGNYAFEGVAPGSYSVETGGTTGSAIPQGITVGSTNITIPVLQVGSLSLTGSVLDPTNNPVVGANLLLLSTSTSDAELGATTTTDTSGDFTVGNLAAGQYTLAVIANGFVVQTQHITVSSNGAPMTVQLQGGTTLSGTITDSSSGLPIAQAAANLISLGTNQVVATVQVDASGAYLITNVPAGIYRLLFADLQGNHAVAETANVVVGSTPLVVNAQLSPASTTLLGRVTDSQNQPISNALVQVTDLNGNVLATAATDLNGVYSISVLPAGQYRVTAVAIGYLRPASQDLTVIGTGSIVGPAFTLQAAGVDELIKSDFDLIDYATGTLLADLFAEFNPSHAQQPEDFQVPQQLQDRVKADTANGACPAELDALSVLFKSQSALIGVFRQYASDFQSFEKTEGTFVNSYLTDLAKLAISIASATGVFKSLAASGAITDAQAQNISFFLPTGQTILGSINTVFKSIAGGQSLTQNALDLGTVANVASLTRTLSTLLRNLNSDPGLGQFLQAYNAFSSALSLAINAEKNGQAAVDALVKLENDRSAYENAIQDFNQKLHALAKAIADCHNPPLPNNPLQPPNNPTGKVSKGPDSDPSIDPNDITGPQGYLPGGFVTPTHPLPYRIDFQNLPTASAAAGVVTVTEQLDPNLDFNTFQLGQFGFGSQVIDVPAGRSSFSTIVDEPAGTPGTGPNGLEVKIDAAVNTQTGVVTWTFTSIDPATQDVPIDPSVGFLPPDDAIGDGEGFVTYSIQPKATLATGTVINAQATVVFDVNAPINTAAISNTIDSGAPTSQVNPLPASSSSIFTLSWPGQDDAGGSGIASFDIFVSDNGGAFQPLLTDTTQTSTAFTGQSGHTYGFYSIATDNVGNVQPTPAAAQTTTMVVVSPTLVGNPVINGDNRNGLFTAAGQGATAGVQRSMVEDVVYTFNEAVTIPDANAAFTVVGAGPHPGSAPASLSATAVPGSNGTQWAVTLTGAAPSALGSIANGEYSITINPSGVFAASDGVTQLAAGRTDQFYRLFGDINGAEVVNAADNLQLKKALTTYNPAFDSNADGVVNAADNLAFKKDLTVAYFGDGFVPTI